MCTFVCHVSRLAHGCEQHENLQAGEFRGNSNGIQGEFRGDSDAKKGIRIKCNENMVRFAMIFDTEIAPSYPFRVFKGLCMHTLRSARGEKRIEEKRKGEK